jgi:general secretion pathway protein G
MKQQKVEAEENMKKWIRKMMMEEASSQGGFSLMEMLIVIALIGMLAALVGSNIIKRFDESKVNTTKLQMRQLSLALDDFRRLCGWYPNSDQGLDALIHAPSGGGRECKNWTDGFVQGGKLPKDAWGNDFAYSSDGEKFVITSFGSDGKEGGDGFAKDIKTDDPDF